MKHPFRVSRGDMMDDNTTYSTRTTAERRQAGHYEIVGETLARIEFFEQGWNPYTRFLDVEKVDFILRRTHNGKPTYSEVQVKYGRLYDVKLKWEQSLFDVTSWRFFREDEFDRAAQIGNLFVAYVLAHPDGYTGDTFIFTAAEFASLIRSGIKSGAGRKIYLSRLRSDPNRWVLRKVPGALSKLDDASVLDVTAHRRAFDKLKMNP